MHRSSQSIASLAAALAKAQPGLVNPEKSLVATIHPVGPGEAERSFRYASLSSGLDIVRKILGQHETATLQTTAMDPATGIIKLTTILAHASGEWIASDWPVCSIADTATPHRMGAALTYARRYGLFTLVGIAGEDDLDAPDLALTGLASETRKTDPSNRHGRMNGAGGPGPRQAVRAGNRIAAVVVKPILEPDKSAALRDQFLAEMCTLASAEAATAWAHKILGGKNSLIAADARCVEDAFQSRLAAIATREHDEIVASSRAPDKSPQPLPPRGPDLTEPDNRQRSDAIDKSALALPEPRRVRDRDHVKFVGRQPCLVCGRRPSDAHHLRFAQHRALGRKTSDEFTVPLCRGHHREVHRCGDEAGWWKDVGLDPTIKARALWLQTHPLPVARDGAIRVADPSAAPAPDAVNSKRDRRVDSQRTRRKAKSTQSTAPDGIT
jgi:ERF superfamily